MPEHAVSEHAASEHAVSENTVSENAVSENTVQRARVLWQQSREDLSEAKRRLRKGAHLESSYLSLQAALNALSCVCSLNGEVRLPSHSPVQMAGLCAGIDVRFEDLGKACEALEEVHERSPFADDREAQEERRYARLCHGHAQSVLEAVRGYLKHGSLGDGSLKQPVRRFFRP